ncbi:MAG: helix-turn-helix domain-containing protein, partial [Alphaproteobacteria bacterium]|nr:helix-turn-helix domain-containing protein [Alphaproteobacteria bacterium]
VYKNGIKLDVKGKEFEILAYLMKHSGQVVDKDVLFNKIWGDDCYTEQTSLNVYIRWLREKIEDDPKVPKLIQTVWKVGYKFGGEE